MAARKKKKKMSPQFVGLYDRCAFKINSFHARLRREKILLHRAVIAAHAEEEASEEVPFGKLHEGLSRWLHSNALPKVDSKAIAKRWKEVSKTFHDKTLDLVIENLAAMEGVQLANETLRATLKMTDAEIETRDLQHMLELQFKMSMANLVTEYSDLTKPQKVKFVESVTAGRGKKSTEDNMNQLRSYLQAMSKSG